VPQAGWTCHECTCVRHLQLQRPRGGRVPYYLELGLKYCLKYCRCLGLGSCRYCRGPRTLWPFGKSGECFLQEVALPVSIRQHTSAYVSIRQHTLAYVSIRVALRKIWRVFSCGHTYSSTEYADT
jgi:hypothetical protein